MMMARVRFIPRLEPLGTPSLPNLTTLVLAVLWSNKLVQKD